MKQSTMNANIYGCRCIYLHPFNPSQEISCYSYLLETPLDHLSLLPHLLVNTNLKKKRERERKCKVGLLSELFGTVKCTNLRVKDVLWATPEHSIPYHCTGCSFLPVRKVHPPSSLPSSAMAPCLLTALPTSLFIRYISCFPQKTVPWNFL